MWDDKANNERLIRNCPFCGGTAEESEDNEMEITIECKRCEASIYRCVDMGCEENYRQECIDAWNRRTIDG